MASIFTEEEIALLSRPHVARAWFGAFDLPGGMVRLHAGVGDIAIGGYTWTGVTNPLSGQLVSLGMVEEPAYGQAAALQIVIAGASREFIASVHAYARAIEAGRVSIYFALFDQESETALTGLKNMFMPFGLMSAPVLQWAGIGRRSMMLTVESVWAAKNYPPVGKWNGPAQRARYPGDKGLDFVGVKISENWQ